MFKPIKYSNFVFIITMIGIFIFLAPFFNISVFAAPKGDPKEGKKIFTDLQCALCHVDGGNISNPDKPLKGQNFLKQFPDDKSLGEVIRKGFPDKGMPGYEKVQLSDAKLADLIAYIRTLTPVSTKK